MLFDAQSATFVTALGTPLNEQGELLEDSFRRHMDNQLECGIDGFLVLGTMGCMPCLTKSTYLKCVEVACEHVGDGTKIMVGVGGNSIEQTMELIKLIKGLKVDAVVATPPYYFVSSQKDLLYYFSKIAEQSEFALYLYNLPGTTKVMIELDTTIELS